jgi:CheY-like chemotaxis protein
LAAAPGEAARLLLSWQEQGGPALSGPPARRGFGAVVVEATVRSQLGGTVTFDWSGAGLHCTIALRAGDTLAEAPPETPAGLRHAADPAPAAPVGRALAGRRVLVVEDEPLVALELATALEEAGCEVVGPATSLAEALDLARAQAHRLDAAVLDANLHGHSSRPVADILAGHRVKVIYVTGYSSLPPGAGEDVLLLSKPLRDGDLLAALDRLLSPAPAAG